MWKVIKKYMLYGVIVLAVYLLLAYHFIYVEGRDIRFLKKEQLNLRYTFFSIQSKLPDTIMKIDDLRWAGIGDVLVDIGMITQEEKLELEHRFDYE